MSKVTAVQGKKLYQHALQRLGNSRNGQRWLAVAIGIETGARIGEVVGLRAEQIIGRNKILIKQTKTGNERTAEVSTPVWLVLSAIGVEREQIFPWVDYSAMYRFLRKNYPRSMFERTAKKRTVTHILRKIAVRIKFESGLSLKQIRKEFGWESPGSLSFYL